MKQKLSKTALTLSAFLCVAAPASHAREPNIPWSIPPGASIGIPAGANPPLGNYFGVRSAVSYGEVYDADGDAIDVQPDATGVALSFTHVRQNKILGASYRFSAIVPFIRNDQATFGLEDQTTSLADITISPLNLSWATAPGIFASAGLSFNLPTGKYEPDLVTANTGIGAPSLTLHGAYSYLRDGWNLTANAALTINAENPDSDYRSGSDLLVDFTAFKNVGNDMSAGVVGYWRKQMSDDENNGTLLGGMVAERAEQIGLGLGFTKNWGPKQLNVNFLAPVSTTDTRGSTTLQINYSIPIGAPKG